MELEKKSPFSRGVDWRNDQTDVFVGIDFGTSYSKVSYTVRGSEERHNIYFNDKDKYYLPSVIYWDNRSGKIKFDNSGEGLYLPELKYFKYTMLCDEPSLKNYNESFRQKVTNNNKERLCSAFYLACLFNLIKDKINNEISYKKINWFFNMGTPLKDPNLEKNENEIYEEILNVGYELSKQETECNEISLDDFDYFYKQKKVLRNKNLHTYPELFAEINLYHKDPNTPEGFYSIIDIGGGTVDMALFFKRYVNGRNEANCVSKDVVPYGFELLFEKSFECDNRLDKKIFNNYPILKLNGKTKIKISDIISLDLSSFYDGFKSKYGKYLYFAGEYFNKELKEKPFVCFFIFGGGKEIKIYHSAMDEINNAKKQESIFIKKSDYHIKNDRLVISQMLAQPFADLIPIDNIMSPAAAKIIDEENRKETNVSNYTNQTYQDKMDNILRERYGY